MDKRFYIFLIAVLVLSSALMITGCANFLASSSAPYIISRSPAIGATNVASDESIVITFNKVMDTSKSLSDAIVFYNQNCTSGYPQTYESAAWSADEKSLVITNPENWIGGTGKVYWTASNEGLQDEDGNSLIEGTVVINYEMAGFRITNRIPYLGEENVSHPLTLEVTFSSSVDATSVLSMAASSDHTAGTSYPAPPNVYFSGDQQTLLFTVSSWGASGVVAISWESDVLDYDKVFSIPAGAYPWKYNNLN